MHNWRTSCNKLLIIINTYISKIKLFFFNFNSNVNDEFKWTSIKYCQFTVSGNMICTISCSFTTSSTCTYNCACYLCTCIQGYCHKGFVINKVITFKKWQGQVKAIICACLFKLWPQLTQFSKKEGYNPWKPPGSSTKLSSNEKTENISVEIQ